MHRLANAGVINVMLGTLNYVDTRLTDHGKRVSYMVYQMLKDDGRFTEEQLRDICMLAMLHDIGAYKTEEIDRMIEYETIEIWDHSIWGYLFLLHFSPLDYLAPAILFHHVDLLNIPRDLDPLHLELAQIINICDRADTFVVASGREYSVYISMLNATRGRRYSADIVDRFLRVHPKPLSDGEINADRDYYHIMQEVPYSHEANEAFLLMNVLSIDFRSPNTATHTVTTGAFSRQLALRMGMDPHAIEQITTGALLHDLGKTGIPIEILEHPGKLSPQAMQVMKRHVVMTELILGGNIEEATLNIAVRHHEKLDGSGYPRGLSEGQLSKAERIVSIADIVSALYEARSYKQSYPKERVLGILHQMVEEGLIDEEITGILETHFDEIAADVEKERDPILQHYASLQDSFQALKAKYDPHQGSEKNKRFEHDDGYTHLR